MLNYLTQRSQTTRIEQRRGSALSTLQSETLERTSYAIIDANVARLNPQLMSCCSGHTLVLEAGEENKALALVEEILSWLQRVGFARRDTLTIVGGGVLCDVGGFAASIYLRGVEYVLIPTSLMAQVDAAIGGKVGVNFGDAKNSIGGFWHPRLVTIDCDTLASLPPREFLSGLAECVKVACCSGSGEFFEYLEGHVGDVLARQMSAVDHVVSTSVEIKWRLLNPDPFEEDLDRALNLGHTTAHALEHATGYRMYLHGEAVSVGVATAARFAEQRGMLANTEAQRIVNLLSAFGLPTGIPKDAVREVAASLSAVRRVRDGQVRLVVPCSIGKVKIVEPGADTPFLEMASE